MLYKTEYASNYIWHENAYSNKPERLYIRGRLRNCSLYSRHKGSLQQLSQPQLLQQQQQQEQLLDSVLYFPLHPSLRRQEDVEVKEKDNIMDEDQIKISSEKKLLTRHSSRQRLSQSHHSTRRYSLDADARGIKSHFLPASLEVLLDLGINPSKSMSSSMADGTGSEANNNNNNHDNDTSSSAGIDGDGGASAKCANQYFTSVYQNDFSCTKQEKYL